MKEIRIKPKLLIFLVLLIAVLILAGLGGVFFSATTQLEVKKPIKQANGQTTSELAMWEAPKIDTIADPGHRQLVAYGKDLIANTAKYFGPYGLIGKLSNGMNCQNCHLAAGTKIYGNNYAAVYATYPKFRARSGTTETIVKRISDCFERSLNATKPDSNGKEMTAMIAYMKFLGAGVAKGIRPYGTGLAQLPYLDRAANPAKGKLIYQSKCISCHGIAGEGIKTADDKYNTYPPLWGPKSYNDAAGLYRISSFAAYVKNNMPLGATYQNQLLTDEEAWDLAAFVNSQPRPHKDQSGDWQDSSKKPIDFPFGPYSDQFTESQHKLGPFKPIEAALKNSQVK